MITSANFNPKQLTIYKLLKYQVSKTISNDKTEKCQVLLIGGWIVSTFAKALQKRSNVMIRITSGWCCVCVSFYRKVAKWWLFWLAVMVYLDFGRIFVNWWTHTRCADDLYGRWDRDRWFFGSRRMGDLECKFCVLYFCCVFNCLRRINSMCTSSALQNYQTMKSVPRNSILVTRDEWDSRRQYRWGDKDSCVPLNQMLPLKGELLRVRCVCVCRFECFPFDFVKFQ